MRANYVSRASLALALAISQSVYASGGYNTVPLGSFSRGFCGVVEASGRILEVGDADVTHLHSTTNDDSLTAAFTSSGGADTSWNGTGVNNVAISTSNDDNFFGCTESGGKLIGAGSLYSSSSASSMSLARFTSAGVLDSTFGSGGKASATLGGITFASGVASQSGGQLIPAGSYIPSGQPSIMAVARFSSSGSLDSTFGVSGWAKVSFGTTATSAKAVAVQSDDKIVAVGNGNGDWAIVRLNSSGSLDTGFGSGGKVELDTGLASVSDIANAVAIQSDGKILVGGQARSMTPSVHITWQVVRLNTDGSLDTSFASSGILKTEAFMVSGAVNGLKIQSDGKILATGTYNTGSGTAHLFAVLRLNTDGSYDTSFAGGAMATLQVEGNTGGGSNAVDVQSDGKVVLFGTGVQGSVQSMASARFNSDGSVDSAY